MILFKLSLCLLLVLVFILPVELTVFGEDEPIDFEMAYNHFASPVIQLRSLIVTWVHYVAHWVVWIVLGNTWAMSRGDQYDSHLNITVNFNRLMSDTEAFQSTLKYFGYSIIGTVMRFAVAKLDHPILSL